MNFNVLPFFEHGQYFKFLIFILTFLLPPVILLSLIAVIKSRVLIMRLTFCFILTCSVILFWARFCEPYLIKIQRSNLDIGIDVKIALISDLHLGLFKNERFLCQIVDRINEEEIDMVLIAGDLTYWPEKYGIDDLFLPFENFRIPVYAVLGNHDVKKPGPEIRTEMEAALKKYNVHLLNNNLIEFENFTLAGLGSKWNGEDDVSILNSISGRKKIIVLTHNPDTAFKYRKRMPDITLCGHLHGGQIRIPFLYKKVMPSKYGFDTGMNIKNNSKIYISAGTGEVGLPMRFLNPPVIDILNCTSQ
ncbi:MAG: metallophosphoesterase [Spirochaetes bacterium]|nr:metallophosphoesterase [Spirochaetota bacterium]